MEQTNTKEEIKITDDGINKDLIQKIVDEKTLEAVKDNKLTKRALANAFVELAEQVEELAKVISSLYNTITTITGPFLADWIYELNQNIIKSQKTTKNNSKKSKNNIQ